MQEINPELLSMQIDYEQERLRPSMRLRPSLSIDGNKWCALYGENLQDGVAGFGNSPAEAYEAFDRAWFKKLENPTAVQPGEHRDLTPTEGLRLCPARTEALMICHYDARVCVYCGGRP